MRYFARLLSQLQEITALYKAGEVLPVPKLLNSVEISGRRMTYFQMGLANSYAPLICLHGFGGFFMDWPRVMAPAAKHFHAFALDLPGWGFSEPIAQRYGMEADVEAVRQFIEKLGLKDVVLVGLSYGAGVAWAAAAMQIPNVRKVVLLNPMPPFPLEHMRSPLYRGIFRLNRWLWTARLGNRLLSKDHFKLICKESLRHFRLLDSFYLDLGYRVIKQPHIPAILHAHARGAREIDWKGWESRLGQVKIPVTILQGLNDRLFSVESSRYLQGLIPTAKLIEVADCGHAMIFDQHRRVSEYLVSNCSIERPADHPTEKPKEQSTTSATDASENSQSGRKTG